MSAFIALELGSVSQIRAEIQIQEATNHFLLEQWQDVGSSIANPLRGKGFVLMALTGPPALMSHLSKIEDLAALIKALEAYNATLSGG